MGTTTNYAFRYPAATDAADGPTQIQNLATDIDTRRYTDRQTAAQLRGSGGQTLTTANTFYVIAFANEDYDNGAGHDNVTNNSRWTVPTGRGGTYWVQGGWGSAPPSTAYLSAQLYKNGVAIAGTTNRVVSSGSGSTSVPSRAWLGVLVATDYIELAAASDVASTVVSANSLYVPTLTIVRLMD